MWHAPAVKRWLTALVAPVVLAGCAPLGGLNGVEPPVADYTVLMMRGERHPEGVRSFADVSVRGSVRVVALSDACREYVRRERVATLPQVRSVVLPEECRPAEPAR